jgi:hypothetical protein
MHARIDSRRSIETHIYTDAETVKSMCNPKFYLELDGVIIATQSLPSGLRTPATVTWRNASSGIGAPPVPTLIDRYGLGFRHESSLFRFTVLNSADFPAKFSWNISGGGRGGGVVHATAAAQRARSANRATPERPITATEMPRAPAELIYKRVQAWAPDCRRWHAPGCYGLRHTTTTPAPPRVVVCTPGLQLGSSPYT